MSLIPPADAHMSRSSYHIYNWSPPRSFHIYPPSSHQQPSWVQWQQ